MMSVQSSPASAAAAAAAAAAVAAVGGQAEAKEEEDVHGGGRQREDGQVQEASLWDSSGFHAGSGLGSSDAKGSWGMRPPQLWASWGAGYGGAHDGEHTPADDGQEQAEECKEGSENVAPFPWRDSNTAAVPAADTVGSRQGAWMTEGHHKPAAVFPRLFASSQSHPPQHQDGSQEECAAPPPTQVFQPRGVFGADTTNLPGMMVGSQAGGAGAAAAADGRGGVAFAGGGDRERESGSGTAAVQAVTATRSRRRKRPNPSTSTSAARTGISGRQTRSAVASGSVDAAGARSGHARRPVTAAAAAAAAAAVGLAVEDVGDADDAAVAVASAIAQESQHDEGEEDQEELVVGETGCGEQHPHTAGAVNRARAERNDDNGVGHAAGVANEDEGEDGDEEELMDQAPSGKRMRRGLEDASMDAAVFSQLHLSMLSRQHERTVEQVRAEYEATIAAHEAQLVQLQSEATEAMDEAERVRKRLASENTILKRAVNIQNGRLQAADAENETLRRELVDTAEQLRQAHREIYSLKLIVAQQSNASNPLLEDPPPPPSVF